MRSESGNAFVITLISVILLGALTFVLSRQMGGTSSQALSSEKAELYAYQVMGTGTSYANVIQQLLDTGATVDTLDFSLPSSGSYTTGNTLVKVYHPSGGGLNVPKSLPDEGLDSSYGGTAGWQVQYGQNVEWTPTSSTDVIVAYLGLADEVCEEINRKITGTATAVSMTGNFDTYFVQGATDGAFTTAECADCVGYPSLCVNNGTTNAFYSIVAVR